MAEDQPYISFAPNRLNGQRVERPPQSWEPPAPATTHMRTYVNGVEQPFIVRGPEEEEEPAPQTAEALGLAQKQADKEAYWRLLDRYAARSRTDYAGMGEDKQGNKKMHLINTLRIEKQRDLLSPLELDLVPGGLLRVPPPVDRRTGSRG